MRRQKRIVSNPFSSRNKWAIRGRALGYFVMSLLFTIASFITEAIIRVAMAIGRGAVNWRRFRKEEKKQLQAAIKPAVKPIGGKKVVGSEPERDDVVAAMRALGCTSAEAKSAAAFARDKLGGNASDEELVKAALQSFRQERCRK
jgi:hypothetical protein